MGLFISAAQAATDAASGDASGGGSGLPQLNFDAFPSQIFWLIVAVVVLYLLFSRSVLPKIAGVMEERADAVEDDLDRAAELKRKAEEAEKAYQKALADAEAEAQRIAAETRAEINKEIEAATAKADEQIAEKTAESEKRIAEIRADAAAAVHEVALDTAQALAEAVAPGAADAEAVRAAVESRAPARKEG
jgi:F-type H+-transporting ATPase subunit b